MDGLRGGHLHADGGQGDDHAHVPRGRRTGIVVRSQRHGQSRADHRPGRGIAHPEEEGGSGQERRHRLRAAQGLDLGLSGAFEVVDREGPAGDADLHAARSGQFVGMDLRPQTILPPHVEDAARLADRKEALVAEDVDEVGQPFAGHGGDHLAADQIDILRLPAAVGACNGMGAEEGGPHFQRCGLADAADHAQHLQLVFGRETVSALDLDAAGSHRRDLPDTLHGLPVELLLGGVVQPVGGVQDPAAAACDLLVGEAVDLVEELLLAAPGIDQMGVRVAERREEHPAFGVGHLVGRHAVERLHASEGGDPLAVGQQPGVVERFQTVHLGAADAQPPFGLNADDAADILDQQPFHRSRRNSTDAAIWGYIT